MKVSRKFKFGLIAVSLVIVLVSGYLVFRQYYQAATTLNQLTTRNSDDFVESIGVNAHMGYGTYNQNLYQQNQATVVSDVNSLITGLGVRHVREGIKSIGSWTMNTGLGLPDITINYYNQLSGLSKQGIKFINVNDSYKIITCGQLATDPIATLTQAQCIAGVSPTDSAYSTTQVVIPSMSQSDLVTAITNMKNAGINIESLESYNEYYTYIPSSLAGKSNYQVYPVNWEQVDSLYTEKVLAPAAQQLGLPLTGPSIVPHFGNATAGCATWYTYTPPLFAPPPGDKTCTAPATNFDDLSATAAYANAHVYQSTYYGGPAAFLKGDNVLNWWSTIFKSLPKYITEMGYNDTQASPVVKGKYTNRMLFELFNSGVSRTYVYEIMDQVYNSGSNDGWGLAGFNTDGTLNIKPAYTTLKNAISLLQDPGHSGTSMPAISASITDPSGGALHYSALANSSGDKFLVLWNEPTAPSTDTDALINGVGLAFDQSYNVSVFRPSKGTTAVQSFTGVSSMSLNVPDDITIVRLQASTQTTSDTTPPTLSITAPTSGATVGGTTQITVSTSDNSGGTVTSTIQVDGATLGSITNNGSISWDTTTHVNGGATISVTAKDPSGNATTQTVSVTVSNTTADKTAPVATITSPLNSTTVSGTVAIKTIDTDNVGVVKVELYIDGVLKATDTSSPYNFSWNARKVASGNHYLVVKAYDAAGNVGVSPTITVTR